MAWAYLNGVGVKKRQKKAFVLSKKSCDLAKPNRSKTDAFGTDEARRGQVVAKLSARITNKTRA